MVGANDGAVDHLKGIRHGPALVQGIHDVFPQPGQRPAAELAVDARPFTELLGEVPPWSARAGDPENSIKNKAVVSRFAPVRRSD